MRIRVLFLSMAVAGCGMMAARGDGTPATMKAGAKDTPKLVMGEKAPEIEAVGLDGKAVTLASLAGKPVVLQFGSLTEPIFRLRAAESEKLAKKYGDKVNFVVLYQRESHPADGDKAVEVNVDAGYAITKPVNEGERIKLAGQAAERLKIAKQTLAVDGWSDTSSLRYGGYPNMTFVLDASGNLQAGYAWMDPGKVKGALDALLAGKAVPAEDRGKTEASTPGQLDLDSSMKEMGGNRGATLASVIDHMTLTDKQKEAVYPAMGAYLAEARTFREKRGGSLNGPPKPAAGAKTDVPAESPEDFAKALESLKATAQKLKATVKENLSEKDAKEVMEALEQGPAKRLFAD